MQHGNGKCFRNKQSFILVVGDLNESLLFECKQTTRMSDVDSAQGSVDCLRRVKVTLLTLPPAVESLQTKLI